MHWNLLRYSCMFALLVALGASVRAEFAGSESCKACHANIYTAYMKSGHPYKLNKITAGPPSYPINTSAGIPHPPAGLKWNDISYVIGGFGWKARFLNQQGYILTGEGQQYNLLNPSHNKAPHWVAYDGKTPSSKPYTCGECHVTGWQATGPKGPHQDNLPGIHGTWKEPGVTCEACHGPSAEHLATPTKVKPTMTENCGHCHARGEPTTIDASGGLIKHHEQYEDLLASPHKAFSCGTCHNPHQSTRYAMGGYKGDEDTCKHCHNKVQIKLPSKANMACTSCHMPFAVTSAISSTIAYKGGTVPKGDLRTHIHRITRDPNWNMFTDDGKFVRLDNDNKAYLTLDYGCLQCHSDQDMDWARTHAQRIH